MQKIEQVLTSMEVAEMVEKAHYELLKDIRRYIGQFNAGNIPYVDFFQEATYQDAKGERRPCYHITKKGCEFIAHKLTGIKGTLFTARYINRFHEMQDMLSEQEKEPELPWFIRRFEGDYIMLFRDFKALTGVELLGNYTALARTKRLRPGVDYNGWAWYTTVDKSEFKKKYGFDYGDDKCMDYLYLCGINRALEIYREESRERINQASYDAIAAGLKILQGPKEEIVNKGPQLQAIADKKMPCQTVILRIDIQSGVTSTTE